MAYQSAEFFSKVVFLTKQKLLNSQPQPGLQYKPRVSPEDYKYNYKRMEEIAEKYNFRIVFITSIFYERGTLYFLGEYLPEGALMVDLFSAFREKELPRLFVDECHLTPQGHQTVAEIVYAFLIKEGIVKMR